MRFIELQRQYLSLKKNIDNAISRVLDHGQYILGPEVHELEAKLAGYAGVKHCVSVASGTDALILALKGLGIGPGDEVITVPFTFVASTEAIALTGAMPIFVDVDPDNFMMDVAQLEQAITDRTKAILPVSLFGQMPDLTKINAIAAQYGLPVLEDAAQSFGATHYGKKSCGSSTVGATSFYPAKPLGCYGDGGAVFTDDTELADHMRLYRTHGGVRRDDYKFVGTNSRLDTIQAAILLEKLAVFDEEVALRREIAKRYDEALSGLVQTPQLIEGNDHIYAEYTIKSSQRGELMECLTGKEIPHVVYYTKCVHQQPAFAELKLGHGSFPVSEQLTQEVLSLPMHPWLTEEEQDRVIEGVLSCEIRSLVG